MWEKFDEATMGIVVRHIKRLDILWIVQENSKRVMSRSGLPDNVFDPGERPTKLVQKRVKVGFSLEDEADNLDRSLNYVKQGSGQVKQHITRFAKQTPTVCPYELVWITGRYIVLLIFFLQVFSINIRHDSQVDRE